MIDLYSEKFLCFYVAGTPTVVEKYGSLNVKNIKTNDRRAVYITSLVLAMDTAIKEQGWELTDEPIYISMKVFVECECKNKLGKLKSLRGYKLPTRRRYPHITSIARAVEALMYGKVYTNKRRVVGVTITREFAEEEGLEVVVGTVGSVGDMIHDFKATQ